MEEHSGGAIDRYTIDGELFFASSAAAQGSMTNEHTHHGKDVEVVGLHQAGHRMRVRRGGVLANGGHWVASAEPRPNSLPRARSGRRSRSADRPVLRRQ